MPSNEEDTDAADAEPEPETETQQDAEQDASGEQEGPDAETADRSIDTEKWIVLGVGAVIVFLLGVGTGTVLVDGSVPVAGQQSDDMGSGQPGPGDAGERLPAVAAACEEKANLISEQYCTKYVGTRNKTYTYKENGIEEDNPYDTAGANDPARTNDLYITDTFDTITCGNYRLSSQIWTLGQISIDPDSQYDILMAVSDTEPADYADSSAARYSHVYDWKKTAAQAGCPWEGNARTEFQGPLINRTVTVDGEEHDCVAEGYLSSTCPVRNTTRRR